MTIEYDEITKRWTLGEPTDELMHSLLKGIQVTTKGVQTLALTSAEVAESLELFREKLCELTPKNNNNGTMD